MTDEDRRRIEQLGSPAAGTPGVLCRAISREALRTHIVRRGIQVMCGSSSGITLAAAADVPLLRATLRLAWLRVLGGIGVKNFVAASGLGHNFVCHIGDIAEFPYYYRRALAPELSLCAAWLRNQGTPVVYDVGANVGFFSTQLSQMLAGQSPQIYAFEPVPTTFAKLVHSVRQLKLAAFVRPIAAAVLDDLRPVSINYSERNSLFSQVAHQRSNTRVGENVAHVPAVSLDAFSSLIGTRPTLIKVDVEGSEAAVLRGARELLSSRERPAIIFEFNPVTLVECGEGLHCLKELLSGYSLRYVDDLLGQRMPFGSALACLEEVHWICNLFAVPRTEELLSRWASTCEQARRTLESCA
jgi:FkbM family methyltransferase